MVHSLKLVYTSDSGESEVRRVTVQELVVNNYRLLAEKIVKLFPQLNGQCFKVEWKDSEGDNIVMSSDEELLQAIANAVDSNGLLRLYISTKTQENTTRKPRSSVVHPGVVCDACNGEVRGYRYKCLECFDYDLCESCHAQDKHPGHDMLKICTAVGQSHNWMFPGWRRMYRSMFGHRPGVPRCGKKFASKPGEDSGKEEKQGASPSSPHAEFLKNIGKSVAFFLDPLGIDVDVMVSESDTDTSNSSSSKKGAEAQTEAGEKEPKNVVENQTESEKDSKNEAADVTPDAKDEVLVNLTAPPNVDMPEVESSAQGVRPKNYGLFQRSDHSCDVKVDSKENGECSSENFNGHEDWTVVNDVPNMKDMEPTVTTKVSYPELPEEKMPSDIGVPKDEVSKDPKISNALSKMCAMGFTNEGGWLLRLLETKNGNINDVLDALYPNRH